MTESQKKLKHLRTTMIQWADENKIQSKKNKQYHVIPQRNGIDWEEDFKFVTKLDGMLSDGLDDKLKKNEMKMCNQLYKYYGSCYDRIRR